MILGIGSDIVEINRIEQIISEQGEKFVKRIFTKYEQESCKSRNKTRDKTIYYYAKRFAAKEACAKALGSGIGKNALFKEIEVRNNEQGAPYIILYGSALKRLEEITPDGTKAKIFLTLSDEKKYALANVIIEIYEE